MLHRIKYRVVVSCEIEIEAESTTSAWNQVTDQVQQIVNREYKDQSEAFEEFDGFLRGCALRLPGSMLVTGIDMEHVGDGTIGPYLQLLQGGR